MTISATVEQSAERQRSTVALIAMLVAAAAGVQVALALINPAPWIVPDEIIYAELAKAIGAGELPAVRDVTKLEFGIVYPLLIAPAWALFSDGSHAYAVARAIGAVVMALSAIPAYVLARRFVSPNGALIIASFAVFLPSMLYSGTVLTEVALYPVSLLVFLALVYVLDRPTLGRQAGVLGAIGVAVATKSLMIVMLPAYVVGVLLMALLLKRNGGDARTYLRRFRPTGALFLLGLVVILLAAVTVGGERRILGYNAHVIDNLGFGAIPWWFLLHLAQLDLYVVAAPFLATMLVCVGAFRRAASAEERLFASLFLPTVFFLLFAIAAFSSDPNPRRLGYGWEDPGARMHERNMFQLVPLLLIGFGMWAERPWRVPRRWLGVGAVATIALVAAIPLSDLHDKASFQAMAVVPWLNFSDVVLWPLGGVLLATLAVVLFLRRRLRAVWALIGIVFGVTALSVYGSFSNSAFWARDAAFGGSSEQRTWIDDAVGRDADVVAVWWEDGTAEYAGPSAGHRIVWLGEFFNRSVGPVYSIGPAMPYSRLPVISATRDPGGVIRDDTGKALRASYVLTCGLDLDGEVVRRLQGTGATVWRIDRQPVRATGVGPCIAGGERPSTAEERASSSRKSQHARG
jgi:hypothetical protein